jgi:hypothetical protein
MHARERYALTSSKKYATKKEYIKVSVCGGWRQNGE